MNTHTTEQLLMCEKADLVKYIQELRGEVEGWKASRDDDIREAEGSMRDELAEVKYTKWFLGETLSVAVASRLASWFPEELMGEDECAEDADMSKVDGDTLVKMIDSYTKYCIEKENEKLKKWSLSKDMIESTSAETIEEFEKDVRDNWKELEELQVEVKDYDHNLEFRDKMIDDLKKEITHKNKKFEEWGMENVKLREEIDELKKCNIYHRCYLAYADPKCDAIPDKEHIDEFADGDEEIKKCLYEDFCIEDEETDEETDDENATYLDGKKVEEVVGEIHGHN